MNKIILNNPSQEDLFDLWCDELIKAGYIEKVYTQEEIPSPIQLFKKLTLHSDDKKYTFLEGITYKPDRVIYWNKKAKGIFYWELNLSGWKDTYFVGHLTPNDEVISLCEVKAPPGYGGGNASDSSFRVKQKWVFEKTGLYVNKVYNYPNSKTKNKKKKTEKFKRSAPYLWMSTFTPERYFYTNKTMVLRTIKNWIPITLKQYIKALQ